MNRHADQRTIHETNRLSWNEATRAHNSHKGDQGRFFREGGSTVYPEELEALGDIRGKRLVHLLCNAGQDSISLAALGASVTGVDISDEAIATATQISSDSGIPASFVRADVYDWLEETAGRGEKFDIAFSSYGAVIWLYDLNRWAQGLSRILAPGGRFVLMEFHPFVRMLESDWTIADNYFSGHGAQKWESGIGDYVARSGEGLALGEFQEGVKDFQNPHECYDYSWPVSEIITALLGAGLRLESFREYPYCNGLKAWDNMRTEGRRHFVPEGMPDVPFMYSLVAVKGA